MDDSSLQSLLSTMSSQGYDEPMLSPEAVLYGL